MALTSRSTTLSLGVSLWLELGQRDSTIASSNISGAHQDRSVTTIQEHPQKDINADSINAFFIPSFVLCQTLVLSHVSATTPAHVGYMYITEFVCGQDMPQGNSEKAYTKHSLYSWPFDISCQAFTRS